MSGQPPARAARTSSPSVRMRGGSASASGGPLHIPARRLTLEGITPHTAADLEAGGDGGFVWLGDGPFPGTRDVSGMVTAAHSAGLYRPEFGMFALVRRDDGRAVGSIAFHGAPDEEGRAEIGYDLVETARGHGYATEAVNALAAWALAREDVRTLCATVEETNTASQRVLCRAGFVRAELEHDATTDTALLLYLRNRA